MTSISQVNDAISDLNEDDSAYIVVQAIIRLGQHGRPAGALLKGHVEGLDVHTKIDFDEGMAWVEDELAA